MVTFLMPIAYFPGTYSTTRSTSRKGNRCGSAAMIWSMFITAGCDGAAPRAAG